MINLNDFLQEMIVASSASPQQSSIVIPSSKTTISNTSTASIISPSIQRIIPITQLSTPTSTTGQRSTKNINLIIL